MIDINKKYRTRDGREVRIYAVDGASPYPVHGAVLDGGGDWYPENWTIQGAASISAREDASDLTEVRPRIQREVWVNVYPDPHQAMSWLFLNRELADSAAASCREERIACVKLVIDVEEGEGL